MVYDVDETLACKKIDTTPSSLRTAVRRNAQMKRQLSKIRKSLTVEEREAAQIINKGEYKLVARLKQLKIRSGERAACIQEQDEGKESNSAVDLLENRSKLQRKKFYRQQSMATLPIQKEETSAATAAHQRQENGSENQQEQEQQPELVSKYQMPSWQRAELIKKQKEEEERKTKIFGRKRS